MLFLTESFLVTSHTEFLIYAVHIVFQPQLYLDQHQVSETKINKNNKLNKLIIITESVNLNFVVPTPC